MAVQPTTSVGATTFSSTTRIIKTSSMTTFRITTLGTLFHHAQRRLSSFLNFYAECSYASVVMLSVVMLSVVILSVVMLSMVLLSRIGNCDKFYFTFKFGIHMLVQIVFIFEIDPIPNHHLSNQSNLNTDKPNIFKCEGI